MVLLYPNSVFYIGVHERQVLNSQTLKAPSACEVINLTSLVGRFHAGNALNV